MDDYKKFDETISKPFRQLVSNIFVNIKVLQKKIFIKFFISYNLSHHKIKSIA